MKLLHLDGITLSRSARWQNMFRFGQLLQNCTDNIKTALRQVIWQSFSKSCNQSREYSPSFKNNLSSKEMQWNLAVSFSCFTRAYVVDSGIYIRIMKKMRASDTLSTNLPQECRNSSVFAYDNRYYLHNPEWPTFTCHTKAGDTERK